MNRVKFEIDGEILNVIGQEPLFGHRSGKKMNTHWMCFMKLERGDAE